MVPNEKKWTKNTFLPDKKVEISVTRAICLYTDILISVFSE